MRIEDYGFIGDTQTGALVGSDGAVDWLCLPRYDSASCFAALVGDERHGRWRLAPTGAVSTTSRRYRPGTLVLETEYETAEGAVRVIDFMPRRAEGPPRLMRIVEGLRGSVAMRMELALRPDYGSITPWVEPASDGAIATAGPDSFRLSTPLVLEIRDGTVSAEFVVADGSRERLTLTWHDSFEDAPPVEDADSALARTEAWWRSWSGRCSYEGPYRDAVLVSLMALKAMTSETTGAIVAAPTTSLPEDIGGVRNWDYRYCWLRDSVLALEALLAGGYTDEALGFRDFMARVGTGDPAKIQIMYGIGGERRLSEFELDELPGYEGSKPVRVGNAAAEQFQLDVYGEVIGVAYRAAVLLGGVEERVWPRWRTIIEYVESIWSEPDDGIWESRGPRRHYTYSKGVTGTIDAISRELGHDGFVARYSTTETDDGLPGGEGQFLACSFWLVNALALNGRVDDARVLFERLLGLSNDLGLLAEEYDVDRARQVGNFPQAFSHLTLIGAAYALAAESDTDPAEHMAGQMEVTR